MIQDSPRPKTQKETDSRIAKKYQFLPYIFHLLILTSMQTNIKPFFNLGSGISLERSLQKMPQINLGSGIFYTFSHFHTNMHRSCQFCHALY